MKTIVVGLDGSDGAADALRWAVAEGAIRGWAVEAVLAWGFLDQHHASGGERFDPDYSSKDANDALARYVEVAVGEQAAASVEQRIVADLPARALLGAAENAALLVVGARGLGGFRGLLLGSVSQKCLHEATCPVAVIRPSELGAPPAGTPRVVVGIDGSATARRALQWAVDEAAARSAVLEVVHGWQPPFGGGFPMTGSVVDFSVYEDAAHKVVASVLDEVDLSALTRPVERSVMCMGPSSALLDASRRAHVTVVGARGLGGLKRMVLGSVSHQVTLHATCPIVVVPRQDR